MSERRNRLLSFVVDPHSRSLLLPSIGAWLIRSVGLGSGQAITEGQGGGTGLSGCARAHRTHASGVAPSGARSAVDA